MVYIDERTSRLMDTIPLLSAVIGRVVGKATSDSGRSDTCGRFALVTRRDEDFAAARFLGGITYKGKLEIIRPHVKQETT